MRVMVIVKADKNSEAGIMPGQELLTAMGKFNEELAKAGIMLAGDGLHPSAKGARVKFAGGKHIVTDGPFAETKELIAGYMLIEVRSRDEALAWAQRFPAPFPGQSCCIEVRPLMGGVDLPPDDAERIIREQLATIKQGG